MNHECHHGWVQTFQVLWWLKCAMEQVLLTTQIDKEGRTPGGNWFLARHERVYTHSAGLMCSHEMIISYCSVGIDLPRWLNHGSLPVSSIVCRRISWRLHFAILSTLPWRRDAPCKLTLSSCLNIDVWPVSDKRPCRISMRQVWRTVNQWQRRGDTSFNKGDQ
jgi:hypothetical protein